MADEQDRADALDDDVIADDEAIDAPGLDGDDRFERLPALDDDYPPDEPLGVEDPGRFEIEDDLSTRDARQADQPEGPGGSDPEAPGTYVDDTDIAEVPEPNEPA